MITTSIDEVRQVKQIRFGEHLIHECAADCDTAEADIAAALKSIIRQQSRRNRWYNRLGGFLFVLDLAFLVWHFQLFFGGDAHG